MDVAPTLGPIESSAMSALVLSYQRSGGRNGDGLVVSNAGFLCLHL